MFLGERNQVPQRSILTGVYHNDNYNHSNHDNYNSDNYGYSDRPVAVSGNGPVAGSLPPTPPDDYPIGDAARMASRGVGVTAIGGVNSWLEIWDYAGGSSFRAFVAENAAREGKSLFVFFDAHVLGRDLKQA